jgi:formylglycine-generating enzyme required for sulfatase activity
MPSSPLPGRSFSPLDSRMRWRLIFMLALLSLLLVRCTVLTTTEIVGEASTPTPPLATAVEPLSLVEQPTQTPSPAPSPTAEEAVEDEPLLWDDDEEDEEQVDAEQVEASLPPDLRAEWVSTVDGMPMAFVPEGAFNMGSTKGQGDEVPVHSVWLDAFWIDMTEVTMEMYDQCSAAGACEENQCSIWTGKKYPAVCVDWFMAKDYCAWAGRRLPAEAEWEKAARGTDERTYPWGEGLSTALAHYDEDYTTENSKPVGSYPQGASPYGALDMAGNAWEWVQDWYDYSYYRSQTTWRNPTGPASGELKIIRGGSWDSLGEEVTATYRGWLFLDEISDDIAFRCVTNQQP